MINFPKLLLGVIIFFSALYSQNGNNDYLGSKIPVDEPLLFAPGTVSTELNERDIAIMPDGNEIYFCVHSSDHKYGTIFVLKRDNGEWSSPKVMKYMENPDYVNFEPHISPDGKRFFFYSNRPDIKKGKTEAGEDDIWVMDRVGNDWSEPYNIGEPVNTEHSEFFPSVTKDGTLYFCRAEKNSRIHNIYRSKLVNGKYSEPELLPKEVNSGRSQFNALISPDESFIIVPTIGRKDTYGFTDYYITYRNEDDTWDGPYNLGSKINSENWLEYSPALSPDGKYFFYMSGRKNLSVNKKLTYDLLLESRSNSGNGNTDIYWIDSKFLRKEYVTGGKDEKK